MKTFQKFLPLGLYTKTASMGKYWGSPWGHISGKLNGSVGGVWKGIDWVRKFIFPTQRGTLPLYKAYKAGLISSRAFSYKQMNIRKAVLSPLGYVGRTNLTNFIIPIWEAFCTKHGLKMTGLNAFIRRNAGALYASIPNANQEYIAATNAPILTNAKVSDGDLEGTPILTAVYTTGTGNLVITWDADVYGNGLATDLSWFCVLKKPILESVGVSGTWAPKLYMYGPVGGSVARSVATATIVLPAGLSAADLTAFLFFKDVAATIGYSISNSLQVTAP
jgi:hypothetical protein